MSSRRPLNRLLTSVRHLRPGLLVLATVAGSPAGCSAIVAGDPVQCERDSDCAARGPDFLGTRCEAGLCVEGVAAQCTKNSDCAPDGDEPRICSPVTRACETLRSAGCRDVVGDATADGAVLIGLLSDLELNESSYFSQRSHLFGASLALNEFVGGAGVRLSGRTVALVGCGQVTPLESTLHLARLGAQAIIGPADPNLVKPVAEISVPAGIPLFTGWVNVNPAAVVPGSARMVWTTTFLAPEVFPPLNAVLAEQEAKVRAKRNDGKPIRVVAAVGIDPPDEFSTGSTLNPFLELSAQNIRFNGKTAAANQNDLDCNQQRGGPCFGIVRTLKEGTRSVVATAQEIAALSPDIIVPFTGVEWGGGVLVELEKIYAEKPEAERPLYVHPFLQSEDAGYGSRSLQDPGMRARSTGIRARRDNSFELFSARYRDAFRAPGSNAGPTATLTIGRAFESTLLVLYALVAANEANPAFTGRDVGAAVARVTDVTGPLVTSTISNIPSAVLQLRQTGAINLDGLFTSFDMDPSTYSARATWETWCVTPAGQLRTDRTFDATSSVLDGPSSCQ